MPLVPTVSVKNYQYGTRGTSPPLHAQDREGLPADIHALLENQLRKGHQYRNKLVEIELWRRQMYDEILAAYSPRLVVLNGLIDDVNARIEECQEALKAKKIATRSRKLDPELKAAVIEAKAMRKTYYAERKELRARLNQDEAVRAAKEKLHNDNVARIREARTEIAARDEYGEGLYWGTYTLMESAAKATRKGPPPKFKKWRGDGRLGVQFQKGVPWEHLFNGSNTILRLTRANNPRTGELTRKSYWCDFRIGSHPKTRKPIFTRVLVVLHRQPPSTARVKMAQLHLRRGVNDWQEWTLTLACEDPHKFPVHRAKSGTVAVDVGWRYMSDGSIRAGYWAGTDGRHGEILIPAGKVQLFRRLNVISSARRTNFNTAQETLIAWLDGKTLPEWFQTEVSTLPLWKSINRLARFVRKWENQRFAGDEEIFELMRTWLFGPRGAAKSTGENHLALYEYGLRNQLLNWRSGASGIYNVLAASFRESYANVVVEQFDLRQFASNLPPELGTNIEVAQRWCMRVACCHSLVNSLSNSGMAFTKLPSEWTTQHCHACDQREKFDAAADVMHTCSQCGVEWDQDHNAALNLLQRYLDTPVPVEV